jgi:hypothetical protein
LNSAGSASKDGFDYSIITDAINASMASVGGILMSQGLINGYNIAVVAAQAANAEALAYSANNQVKQVSSAISGFNTSIRAINNSLSNFSTAFALHTHTFNTHTHNLPDGKATYGPNV